MRLWPCTACLALCSVVSAQEVALQQVAPALTPCQRCCAPGGDCSKAFKGMPGKCCGVANGQAFCCPGMMDGAKCYNCGSSYRCYTGLSSHNICGSGGGGGVPHHHHSAPHHHPYYKDQPEQSSMGSMLMIGILVFLAVIFCARRQHDHFEPVYGQMPHGKPIAYGVRCPPAQGATAFPQAAALLPCSHGPEPHHRPRLSDPWPYFPPRVIHPCCNAFAPQAPMQQPYPPQQGGMMMQPYGGGGMMMPGYGGGYSGTAVAGSAAAGFVGGMLLSDAMSSHHHGGGHYADYGGGGYSGGGDYGGGGDFGGGGGDSGFASDS